NYRTRNSSAAGAAIVEVSRLINAGDDLLASGVLQERSNVSGIEFEGVELLSTPAIELDLLLDRWAREQIAGSGEMGSLLSREYLIGNGAISGEDRAGLTQLCEYRARARILCATRIGASGADAINAQMHRLALRNSAAGTMRTPALVGGEPVIVVRND